MHALGRGCGFLMKFRFQVVFNSCLTKSSWVLWIQLVTELALDHHGLLGIFMPFVRPPSSSDPWSTPRRRKRPSGLEMEGVRSPPGAGDSSGCWSYFDLHLGFGG